MILKTITSSHISRWLAFLLSFTIILNTGSTTLAASPTKIIQIASAEEISLALDDLGQLYSWGFNWNGQLGDNMDGWGQAKPKPGIILKNVVDIAAGAAHTLAKTNNGYLYAFGSNWDGQLGIGGSGLGSSVKKPLAVMSHVYTMAAGAAHSLVVTTDNALWVFGRNRNGQLGNGNLTSETRPQKTINSSVYDVAAGDRHSLALLADGTLLAWGANEVGQLGTGDLHDRLVPTAVLSDVYKLYAGRVNSFAILSDSSLWGWGQGISSLIDENATDDLISLLPIKIMDNIQQVAIGANHLLILTNDGKVYISGQNWLQQLGLPHIQSISTPQLLVEGISQIAAGGWHSLALTNEGSLLAWGDNTYGQLGDQSFRNINIPSPIAIINLEPSILFNEGDSSWSAIKPKLAVDRIVLPLDKTFDLLNIPYSIIQNSILEFDYKGATYQHLIGSSIFFSEGRKVSFPLSTQSYQKDFVFLAFNTVELFGYDVRWDSTAQLLFLTSHDIDGE